MVAPDDPEARGQPGAVALLALAVIGVAIAGYLTAVHYTPLPLVCSTTGIIDCARVTSSSYSLVPGTSLPITVPGILWFLVSGALAGASLAHKGPAVPLRLVHVAWAASGVLAALYLVFIEIVRLHRICLWCSAAHLVLVASFLIALGRLQALGGALDEPADVDGEASPADRGPIAGSL